PVGGRLRPEGAHIRAIGVDLTGTNEPTRLLPDSNGIGHIDARLNTLLSYRQGRLLVDGASTLIESSHAVESEFIALSITPQLSLVAPNDSSRRYDLRLQELQLRFLLRNVALDVGREYMVWGEGRDVGLLNSNNSPPLDLI